MMLKVFFVSVLMLMSSLAVAQNSRETGKEKKISDPDPGATYSVKKKNKKANKSYSSSFDQKIDEHHERMEANAKENARIAREMQKPQYSDPSYFGHKKKPKKRPNGKKKFCKECGMTH